MAHFSLDLSDRAALGPLARVLMAVQRAAGDTSVLLIGAAARDLLLVHANGVEVQRATEDADLAIDVRNWEELLRVRAGLLASEGCVAGGPLHQLWLGDQRLDIIPFGGVERPDRSIAWPPQGAEVMNTAGLSEALATAVAVRMPGGVIVKVASLPAIAVLKTWAWADRKYTAPGKDASDLEPSTRHRPARDRQFLGCVVGTV